MTDPKYADKGNRKIMDGMDLKFPLLIGD